MTDTTDPLDSAWESLRLHWSEPERHRAFVALAGSLGRLADAAARYRQAEADPALAEEAARGKQLVLARAMAELDALPRTSLDQARQRAGWLVPLSVLGLLLLCSFLLASLTHRREFVSPLVLAVEILLVALVPWRRILG